MMYLQKLIDISPSRLVIDLNPHKEDRFENAKGYIIRRCPDENDFVNDEEWNECKKKYDVMIEKDTIIEIIIHYPSGSFLDAHHWDFEEACKLAIKLIGENTDEI